MKLLIFSDSHGKVAHMTRVVEQERPDTIVHLGDCWRDAACLGERFPEIRLEQVVGNCDFCAREPAERLVELGGRRILLCHGHTYGVKQSLLSAWYAAQEKQVDLFLFGHTHKALHEKRGELTLLNPGSIGEYGRESYAVVEILGNRLAADLKRLN